jgi:wobble nucleotide-excising tRNase
LIDSVEDEKRIVFIVDDPASSMDFQFVYTTASLLKNISKTVGFQSEGNSLLLLTHNTELAGILFRNNIFKSFYTINDIDEAITRLKEDQLLMPYYPHLRDVIRLARGGVRSHTSANSMRHVLEVLATFNCIELRKFAESIELFAKLPLIQDLSHGAIRFQAPYQDSDFQEAAQAIVGYITDKHPLQIKRVSG